MPITDPIKRQIAQRKRLYLKICFKCGARNSMAATRCRKCHSKTNFNRNHWTRFFQMQIFIKEFFNPENILIFNEKKQLIGLDKFI